MDHDLLLDLAPLDDPEPPSFGALRAEEAVRRAAQHHSRRARALAGAVLAVALVAGVSVAGLRSGGSTDTLDTAGSAPPEVTEPATTLPSTVSVPPIAPPTTAPGVPPAGSDPAPAATTTLAPGAPGPAAGATTTRPPGGVVVPSTRPSAAPPAPWSPQGSVPAPADLRYTVTLDATRVPVGGSVRAVVRFENLRSTPVNVRGGGCTEMSMWRPDLYQGGVPAPADPECLMATGQPVPAGQVFEVESTLSAHPDVAPGDYDAFSTITVDDQLLIHSDRVVVTVFRP